MRAEGAIVLGAPPDFDACKNLAWNPREHAELATRTPLSIDPSTHLPIACGAVPPRSRTRGGGCCCAAVAGAGATLELNSTPMPPHYAPLVARRAARCCSASMGESASRWRPTLCENRGGSAELMLDLPSRGARRQSVGPQRAQGGSPGGVFEAAARLAR